MNEYFNKGSSRWFSQWLDEWIKDLSKYVAVEPEFFQHGAVLEGHGVQGVKLVVVDGQEAEDGEARQRLVVDGLEVVVREDERVEVVQRDEGVRRDRVKLETKF